MSALGELQAGMPSTAFAALLRQTVLATAAKHNFPPPDGGTWDADKADEIAYGFLAQDRAQKVLEALVLSCGDDRALAWALQGVVRNHLRDRGRSTEVGRLIVRLRRALKNEELFTHLPGDRWALVDGPEDASEVGPDALVAATATVRVKFQAWSPMARRRHPFADKDSIDALVVTVLTAAQGSLRAADIAHAVAPALQVVTGNVLIELDSGDPPDTGSDIDGLDMIGADLADRERALEVFGLLTDREKIALAHPELNTRELAPLIGLGHSQAAVIRNKAVEMLQEELGDEENGQNIAELVLQITKFWVEHRTGPNDVTYNSA
jgi:hypothetical protein